MAKRKYLDCDIGIETDDLTFFRTLADLYQCPVSDVIDVALRIGADAIRSGTIRIAPRPVPAHAN